MPEDAPWEPGFGWTTVWGALFVGFIMLPGAIYLGLVTGQSLGGAAQWVSIILFIEIARRSFGRMKAQEIIILYWVAGGLLTLGGKLGSAANIFGGPFGGFIWDQYLINSQQAVGLAEHIPNWAMPPLGSAAYAERTFLNLDYVKPIVVLATAMVLSRINSLSLGYVLFRVTNDIEKLPYPMAPVYAGGATALAESSAKQEGWRWRVFSTGTFIGVIWGAIYVVVPTLSGIFLTDVIQILPIPFADFTPAIRALLPATILGIATNLGAVLAGFVLPFWVVVGSFVGSMAAFIVANPILYKYGILHSWSPGMKAIPTSISNTLDFWLSFNIGPAVLVALLGMGLAITASVKRYMAKPKPSETGEETEEIPAGRGDIPFWKAFVLWGIATAGSVLLVYILVPTFPWWITAIFGFLWTPFSSYVGARMIGLTGSPYGASFPYLREGSFYLSGYKGADVWFAPIPAYSFGGSAQTYKQLELTKCRFSSLVYLNILTLVVMFVCSFVFWSLVWKLAPIPSAAYPFVQLMWPLHATMQALWASSTLPASASASLFGVIPLQPDMTEMTKGTLSGPLLGTFYTGGNLLREVINFRYIFVGFIVATATYSLCVLLGIPTLIFYGMVGGLYTWPMYTIPQFLGAIVGRYYLRRRFGQERWRAYAPILLAGYSCGMGLIGMTSIAVALIYKATSQITF